MTAIQPPCIAARIRVRGQVQGVGFRPHVWRQARRFGLRGQVLNDAEGVLIEVGGDALDGFLSALRSDAPPLARIDTVERGPLPAATPLAEPFEIAASGAEGAETAVTPDAATCAACLAEIRGARGRRSGYAFTNCTHCGPRFTILRGLPYDRARTTMAPFEMCAACAEEYADPGDRRFHAQPIACPDCGPHLWLERDGTRLAVDPIAEAADLLRGGEILGVKGLGGVHLACDARNAAAVEALRLRKRRPTKPLALMGTEAVIRAHAALAPQELARLSEPAAPILLLSKAGAPLPDLLAPCQERLGWMLPYTPLHHLLLDAFGGPLVMTSANLSGQPQVIGNDEAREKLEGVADALLLHNREIARRLDDSVERVTSKGPMILRRGRGRVPETLPLPPGFAEAPQVLAFGGQLKSAICLIKNGQALLSHHLGDLDDALTVAEFEKADADYGELFDHAPEILACDLHPDYRSSVHAVARAGETPLTRVQHHHAHLAACLAENGWPADGGKVAGVILDGLGLGPDGTIWGGEVLLGDYTDVTRAAYLAPAPLPGGEAAQREPWRNLLMRLDAAGLAQAADEWLDGHPLTLVRRAVAAGVNAPLSSSAGRLFDAVAAAVGCAPDRQSFEGEAAMALEACATGISAEPYPLGIADGIVDPAPLFQALAADRAAGRAVSEMAAAAHAGIATAFATEARDLVSRGAAKAVALSGGCFQNAVLLEMTCAALRDVPVLVHTRVPANDGGLALGQAVIAAAQSRAGVVSD